MQYIPSHDGPAYQPQHAEGSMPYTATLSEAGYPFTNDETLECANRWFQLALPTQQSDAVFAVSTSPQCIPVARPFNDVTYDNIGYPAPDPYDVGSLQPGLLRRHTVHAPHSLIATGHGYGTQHETGFAASFPQYEPSHRELPPSFENGLMSPQQTTTSSSRTSITSLDTGPPSYSPIALSTYQALTNFDPQSSPMSTSSLLGFSYPHSPSISDGSPTIPLAVEQPSINEPDPTPESIPCQVLGCKAKFTGDYQKGNLKRHVKSCHSELLAPNGEIQRDLSKLKCSRCSFVFKRSDARKKHEYRAHRVGLEPPKKYQTSSL
jgi:hypothetical protein